MSDPRGKYVLLMIYMMNIFGILIVEVIVGFAIAYIAFLYI